MSAALVVGIASTAILVFFSAISSAEWSKRRGPARVVLSATGGRGILGLIVVVTLVGIPAAVGLVPGSLLVVMGALATVTWARALLAFPGTRTRMSFVWLAAVWWSLLPAAITLRTFDVLGIQAAYAVFGPLGGGSASALLRMIALVAGTVAAAGWVNSLPAMWVASGDPGPLEDLLRWGHSALAAAAVSATLFGPSVGSLVYGPRNPAAFAAAGASGAVTLACAVSVSLLRRIGRLERRAAEPQTPPPTPL